ncbi:hypothetical protein HDV05_000912 [Chytridiales sp. JEL 0842]|nr:hypothetical protein HDV05_000912 [Chytridiales sp. JEL 0842]
MHPTDDDHDDAQQSGRLLTVLELMPTMRPEVTDASRHEKILSFLKDEIAKGPDHVDYMIHSLNAFKTIEDCLSHSDYRVKSLAFRFAGFLVSGYPDTAKNPFCSIQKSHPIILESLLTNILDRSTPAPLLFGCLVTLSNLLKASLASRCDSLASHQLLSQILVSGQLLTSLTNSLSPSNDPERKLATLELIWKLCQSNKEVAMSFFRDGVLLKPCCQLLCDKDRITRSRVVDILEHLFSSVYDPLFILQGFSGSATDDFVQFSAQDTTAFLFNQIAMPVLQDVKSVDGLCHMFSVFGLIAVIASAQNDTDTKRWISSLALEVGDMLLDRDKSDRKENYLLPQSNIRQLLAEACIEHTKKYAIGSTRNRRILLHQIIQVLRKDWKTGSCQDAGEAEVAKFTMSILKSGELAPDARLLKTTMELVEDIARNGILSSDSIKKLLDQLVTLLETSSNSSTVLKYNLNLIVTLLNTAATQNIHPSAICDAEILSKAVYEKLFDTEWSIRSLILSFIGSLYESHIHPSLSPFGNSIHVPKHLLKRLSDPEMMVRVECLRKLGIMFTNPHALNYFEEHNSMEKIAMDVVRLSLEDPEASVRAEAVGTLIILLRADTQSAMSIIIVESVRSAGTPIFPKILSDDDSEVRQQAVKLLAILCRYELEGQLESSFLTTLEDIFNQTLDTSRPVRLELVKVLQMIQQFIVRDETTADDLRTKDRPLKKFRSGKAQVLERLSALLQSIDIDKLKKDSEAEYLYAEALDIDRGMVRASDEEIDTHFMECYDC